MSSPVFGYGSLILPYSVIARFDDNISDISPVYENRTQYTEDRIVRQEAVESWDEKYSDVRLIPVKTREFIRAYTYESPRGGAMLEAYHTGREEDVLNGVIITGLSEEQAGGITASESGYDIETLPLSSFDVYPEVDAELPDVDCGVTICLGGFDDASNWQTERLRNQTYHSRIIRGIKYLGEHYGEKLQAVFRKDFEQNTYEHPSQTVDISAEVFRTS